MSGKGFTCRALAQMFDTADHAGDCPIIQTGDFFVQPFPEQAIHHRIAKGSRLKLGLAGVARHALAE